MDDWLDPRPAPTGVALAPRAGGGRPRRLVFFDNGKLSPPYERWTPVVAPLLAALAPLGTVRREGDDLLMASPDRYPEWVAAWQADGVDGVVFALCDAGVTQPTLTLAAAAEAAGIATTVVCIDQVVELAATVAHFMAPGLPLVVLAISRLDTPAELAAAATAAAPQIVEGLIGDPAALRARAAGRFPFLRSLARGATPRGREDGGDGGDGGDFDAYAARCRMSDGLPVRTPTRAVVDRLLAAAGRPGDEVLVERMSPSGASLTVEGAAICAAMAGCAPDCFALVLAAFAAMRQPRYQLPLAATTSHPGANLLLFSGPRAWRAGVASGRGCLGPAHPANLAIGRAVGLALQNVGRAIPGLTTLSMLGSPAQLACCFADAEDAPLAPLHRELAGSEDTIVWAHKVESPHNVMDHVSSTPRSLLASVASVAATLGGNNAYLPSDLLVILNPEHARIATQGGWRRADIQQYLWEQARNVRADLAGRGIKPSWPAGWADWPRLPVTPTPDRIVVVVAGAPGPQSQVAVPWGYCDACLARVG